MLAEARVLDLHDLLPDLPDDLLAPPVRLDQVMALRRQVRPLLLRSSGIIYSANKTRSPRLTCPRSDPAGTQGTEMARFVQGAVSLDRRDARTGRG